jgi:hypothetical protein
MMVYRADDVNVERMRRIEMLRDPDDGGLSRPGALGLGQAVYVEPYRRIVNVAPVRGG